jgi:2-hydroxy-3-oxopropionate reductase
VKLGFIGLGTMGRPMSLNLLRAGHELAVFARRSEALAPLAAAGAMACGNPREVASRAEVVFTMVTSDADVTEVVLGRDGVIEGAAPGSVVVDTSTIAAATARHIAARLAERGIDMLDAPVSGGPQGAAGATLSIMVGGKPDVLSRMHPLLEVLGKTITHIGSNGAGQVAKACNQMVMVAAIEGCAEALLLAQAAGVDARRVRAALQGGAAGSRVLDLFGERMLQRDFAAGVEARLHHKDFGNLMQEAAGLNVPLPLMAQVRQQLVNLMALGWGGDDTSSLLRVLEMQSRPAARA